MQVGKRSKVHSQNETENEKKSDHSSDWRRKSAEGKMREDNTKTATPKFAEIVQTRKAASRERFRELSVVRS